MRTRQLLPLFLLLTACGSAGGSSEIDVIPLVRIDPHPLCHPIIRPTPATFVILEFTVTPGGEVADPVVIQSQPSGTFDRAALEAVSKWRYKPLYKDGEAVARRGVRVRLDFSAGSRSPCEAHPALPPQELEQ